MIPSNHHLVEGSRPCTGVTHCVTICPAASVILVSVPAPNPPPPERQDPRDTLLLEQLAQARASGDSERERRAIGELIAGWQGPVEAYARFRGFKEHEVDEILGRWSERMVKALANRTSFVGAFGAVAMMNANWACRDQRRETSRRRKREQPTPDPAAFRTWDDEPGADEPSDAQAALDAALDTLTPRQRAIVNGIYRDGKDRATLASELEMSEGALRTALCRALAKVRGHLRGAGVTNRGRASV